MLASFTFVIFYFILDETTKPASLHTERPLRTNTQRASFPNRGSEVNPRGRNLQNNGGTTNTRRAKQLQPLVREISPTTDAPTTPKPYNLRSRSSPFIWHRPNVATVKSIT